MPQTLYTLGYTGKGMLDIKLAVTTADLCVVDCRFQPHSRAAIWTRSSFEKWLGNRYQHVGALGNRNYKLHGMENVEIVDLRAGSAIVSRLLAEFAGGVILMCACSNYRECHRLIVAEALAPKLKLPLIHLDHLTLRQLGAGQPLTEAEEPPAQKGLF